MTPSLGILGLGKRSTLFYKEELSVRLANSVVANGGLEIPLIQADFDQINPYLPDNHSVIKENLKSSIDEIVASNIAQVIVPNITLHKVLDEMELPFQLIHPLELMERKLALYKLPVMIIGTRHTSKNSFIGKAASDRGFELILAEDEDVEQVDQLRLNIFNSVETAQEVYDFNALVNRLAYSYTVIIACTELSIANLHSYKTLDLGRFQIEEAARILMTPQLA